MSTGVPLGKSTVAPWGICTASQSRVSSIEVICGISCPRLSSSRCLQNIRLERPEGQRQCTGPKQNNSVSISPASGHKFRREQFIANGDDYNTDAARPSGDSGGDGQPWAGLSGRKIG